MDRRSTSVMRKSIAAVLKLSLTSRTLKILGRHAGEVNLDAFSE